MTDTLSDTHLRWCPTCTANTRWLSFPGSKFLGCLDCGERWVYAYNGFGIVRHYTNLYT